MWAEPSRGTMALVTVRAARSGDEQALAEARVRGWQVGYDGIVAASHLDSMSVVRDTTMWESLLPAQTGLRRTLVVEAAGDGRPAVAGFCSLGPYRSVSLDEAMEVVDWAEPGTVGEIYAFYLHPGHWGSGLADELMQASLRALTDDGWPLARLWVLAENSRALRFYERHGWTLDGERQTLPVDGLPVEVRMQRVLA